MSSRVTTQLLGYSGLLPFFGFCIGFSVMEDWLRSLSIQGFVIYSLAIFAFLAGALWGQEQRVESASSASTLVISNGLVLFESGAILQYLSENYANEVNDAATRASISQWILFANSTLAIALFVPSNKEREFPRLMATLNDIYTKKQFLVGDCWTAADCAVNAYLGYLPIFYPNEDLSAYPEILALNERTRSNPNYRTIMGL